MCLAARDFKGALFKNPSLNCKRLYISMNKGNIYGVIVCDTIVSHDQ